MKVFVIENNYLNEETNNAQGWYFLPDSAVTNTGKPFYIPENVGKVTVSLSCAIRISRLGKCIDSKFAERYYREIAPSLHFRLPDLGDTLKRKGLSDDASKSFDKSLFIGDFLPLDNGERVELIFNNKPSVTFNMKNLIKPVNELIHMVSVMNTLKMGDLLLPALNGEVSIHEGDLLEVRRDGELAFHVRVK